MITTIAHGIGTFIGYCIVGVFILTLAITIIAVILGGILIFVLGVIGADGVSCSYDDTPEYVHDEDMYCCTAQWRNIHKFGYNPHTGGWTAEEDAENGW